MAERFALSNLAKRGLNVEALYSKKKTTTTTATKKK